MANPEIIQENFTRVSQNYCTLPDVSSQAYSPSIKAFIEQQLSMTAVSLILVNLCHIWKYTAVNILTVLFNVLVTMGLHALNLSY